MNRIKGNVIKRKILTQRVEIYFGFTEGFSSGNSAWTKITVKHAVESGSSPNSVTRKQQFPLSVVHRAAANIPFRCSGPLLRCILRKDAAKLPVFPSLRFKLMPVPPNRFLI